MRRLISFTQVTLDGYFSGEDGDFSWAHQTAGDEEWSAYVAENAGAGGALVFGRVTYELMASYWPTPQAKANDPAVAEAMNSLPKVVFSRTLATVSWENTQLVKGDLAAEIRKMKQESGTGMAILGSGSIVSQLAQERLIDELQIVVNPVVLGEGRTLFEGAREKLRFKQTQSRTFRNGNVLLCYEPKT